MVRTPKITPAHIRGHDNNNSTITNLRDANIHVNCYKNITAMLSTCLQHSIDCVRILVVLSCFAPGNTSFQNRWNDLAK